MKGYFYDTYAIFEILEKNNAYLAYISDVAIVTTKLNLMEIHFHLYKRHSQEIADRVFDRLTKYTVEVPDDILKAASAFRAQWRRRDLSYIDCIGYVLAKRIGIPFLTGDQQFVDMENVEFVK
ncbi:MAG: PIN domain-containing protein [Nanoarchaeota archaeon]